jgi:predicted RNA-binding Zn ribbon-like protein
MSHNQSLDPQDQPAPVPRRRPAPQLQSAAQSPPSPHEQLAPHVFDLDGGRACLDFANTMGASPVATDHLATYADLVAFAAQSDLITPEDADWLRNQGDIEPVIAAGVLTRAKRLRAAMRAIFSRLAAGKKLSETDLGVLNFDLAASLSHARVVPTNDADGYRWGWSGRNLDAPLWPITRSAADLLTSDAERALVRVCGADDCAWLFMDTTRNRSRQWCSMQSCGNREKARRHYQRVRGRDAGGSSSSGVDAPRGTSSQGVDGPRGRAPGRQKQAAPSADASATAD